MDNPYIQYIYSLFTNYLKWDSLASFQTSNYKKIIILQLCDKNAIYITVWKKKSDLFEFVSFVCILLPNLDDAK